MIPNPPPLPMDDSTLSSPPYRVSIWEAITVFAGAIFLILIGLAGLGIKAMNNAFDPDRAAAIAHSLIDYSIPGGSKGLFGATIGGGKMAVITSTKSIQGPLDPAGTGSVQIPEIELFVSQIPVDEKTDPPGSEPDLLDNATFFSGFSFSYQTEGAFQISRSHTENQLFCGTVVPVTIQEGVLRLSDQKPPVPAVRYEARVDLDSAARAVILSTVGQNATANASRAFRSLRCVSPIAPQPL